MKKTKKRATLALKSLAPILLLLRCYLLTNKKINPGGIMTKTKKLLTLLVLAVMATFLVTKVTSSSEAVAYDYEERERLVDTVEFDDYGNDSYENKEECKEYRRYDDYRCDSDKYRCTRCTKESSWGDGYEYDVYKIERRRPEPDPEPEPVEFWVNSGTVSGTSHWVPKQGGDWPYCDDTHNRNVVCQNAGYNRQVGGESAGSGRCVKYRNGRNGRWDGTVLGRVKCAY